MTRLRRSALIALLGVAPWLTACKGKCQELSENLCSCASNSLTKDACLRRASNEQARISPTEEDETLCEGLIKTCSCENLTTPEGKRACGLAR